MLVSALFIHIDAEYVVLDLYLILTSMALFIIQQDMRKVEP